MRGPPLSGSPRRRRRRQPDTGFSETLGNDLFESDVEDAKASPALGGSTPDRSKLLGSHGQTPRLHQE